MKRTAKEKNEWNSATADSAQETKHGDTKRGGVRRTVGAATKDNRHGLATDRSTSRRTESRRQGYMGRESKSRAMRKNV